MKRTIFVIVQAFLALIFIATNTIAQEIQKNKSFLFGVSVETGIPYLKLDSYGFAVQGEYMLSKSFGLGCEYSSLKYKGKIDQTSLFNEIDVTITAPALFIYWHTPTESTFQMFVGVGVGSTNIQGKIGSNNSFFLLESKQKNILIPQAKIGIEYLLNDRFGLKCNLGFYRLLSIGFDYFI